MSEPQVMLNDVLTVHARAAAVVAASNVLHHHHAMGGPLSIKDHITELAEPLLKYILSGE